MEGKVLFAGETWPGYISPGPGEAGGRLPSSQADQAQLRPGRHQELAALRLPQDGNSRGH